MLEGVPPRGFIFVEWAQEEYGHSLVAEQDVILLNRPLTIGDTVKRVRGESGMAGTVVNVENTYVLEPIVRLTRGVLDFAPNERSDINEGSIGRSHGGLPPAISHPRPHELLYDIPAGELKRADDFEDGDYVIRKDWIGVVEDSDMEVVLLLDNNTLVIVQDSEELELVIPDFNRPLITLPDLDGIRRPDVVAAHAGGLMSTPYHQLARGQFVITNHKNLRNGRWLRGAYKEGCKPQGRILDIRTSHLDVQWLCPNAFSLDYAGSASPNSQVRPYENLGSFVDAQELRRNKTIALYDRFRYPAPHDHVESRATPVSAGQDFDVGDSVRFRDTTAAAVKYQSGPHGRFHRVPKASAYGFDLSEFRVIATKQTTEVQWQDQTRTKERSISLKAFTLPEAELTPGDIVTLKEGMMQIAAEKPDEAAVEFNEMLYFQGNFVLRPQKIGVIQSVDSKERLAQIRLFANPTVDLLEQGNVLRAGSRLGPVSDVYEEVSLYEVMSHPALMRRRRDLVIIPPELPYAGVLLSLQSSSSSCQLGPSTLSYLRSLRPDSKYEHLRNIAKHFIQSQGLTCPPGTVFQNHHDANRPLDWIGEIVDIGLDGLLTVRLGGLGTECHDLRVPFERILMILDEDAELDDGSTMMSAEVTWSAIGSGTDYDSDSVIEEEVEYEGGQRLDDGSDDDWMTDDETDLKPTGAGHHSSNAQPSKQAGFRRGNLSTGSGPQQDVVMGESMTTQQLPRKDGLLPHNSLSVDSRSSDGLTGLINLRGNDEPPAFSILEIEPSADQYGVSGERPSAFPAAFLRRINKEHRILSTSLPAKAIYVRTYESRLDLMRCLIVGPADTPYEHCPFVVDFDLKNFPAEPPNAHFHSWTGGLGRINPNLYEEGKICLSLLNTWPGQTEGESWSEKASILQVLVSLMGLVLVDRPFYNEAGFEGYHEEKLYRHESQQYSEKAFVMARGFVKHALNKPPQGLEDVLSYLYLPSMMSAKASQNTLPHNSEATADEWQCYTAILPDLPSLPPPLGYDPTHLEYPEVTDDLGESNEPRPEPGVRSFGLLYKIIGRSRLLIQRSAELRGSDDVFVDGAGRSKNDAKAFLKPLSKGAVVMLRKTVDSLLQLARVMEEHSMREFSAGVNRERHGTNDMNAHDNDIEMT